MRPTEENALIMALAQLQARGPIGYSHGDPNDTVGILVGEMLKPPTTRMREAQRREPMPRIGPPPVMRKNIRNANQFWPGHSLDRFQRRQRTIRV